MLDWKVIRNDSETQVICAHDCKYAVNFCNKHGRIKKPDIVKDSAGAWDTKTKETEWLIAIQLGEEHGSGQKNSIWLWFKTCWKWVQGSLILSSLQEQDHTYKSVKWYALKPDTLSSVQLQKSTCNVVCAQQRINTSAPSVKLACTVPRFVIYHTMANFWEFQHNMAKWPF